MKIWRKAFPLLVVPISISFLAGAPAQTAGAGPVFTPRAFNSPTPNFAALPDLDGDGSLDLLVLNGGSGASGGSGSAVIGYGDGTGEFSSLFPVPFTNTTIFLDARPNHAAVADLNHDGFLDLVFAIGSGEVEVFRGLGLRTFAFRGRYTTRFGTNSVEVADLNHDGNPDLVTANYNDSSVSVLLGDGTGAFTTLPRIPVGPTPDKAVVADFNGDTHPDIATSNDFGNNVTVLLGNGTGAFPSRTDMPTTGGTNWVATADVNEDGIVDLVTSAFDGGVANAVSVFIGNGNGTFQPHHDVYLSTVAGAYGLAVRDLNGDGHADIAFTNDGSGTVSVLLGDGQGNFSPFVAYGTGRQPLSVSVGDVNGDGKVDLAVANTFSGSVTVSLGNGDGTFGARMFTTGPRPQAVAIGDFDHDGKADLASSNLAGNSITTFLGNGDGTYHAGATLTTGLAPAGLKAGDFNLDGFSDLAVANDSSNTVSLYLSNGNGTFTSKPDLPVGMGPVSVAIADFNGDAKPDLAVANSGAVNVSVFLGKGDGTFKGKNNYGTDAGSRHIAAADVDRDGKMDLVVANYDGETVSILLGTGNGGFKSRKNLNANLGGFEYHPRYVAVGDWSGDGLPDIAAASDLPPSAGVSVIELFQQNPDGTFGDPITLGSGVARAVEMADVDGDGRLDLVVPSETACTALVYRNLGGGNFDITTFGTGSLPRGLAVGDLNGDGRPDLAVANFRTPGISILLNRAVAPSLLAAPARSERAATATVKPLVSPNPFNPQGRITFSIARAAVVSAKVYDVQGRLVRILLDRQALAAGEHQLLVDGKDQNGARLASGVYLYRIDTPAGPMGGRFTIMK